VHPYCKEVTNVGVSGVVGYVQHFTTIDISWLPLLTRRIALLQIQIRPSSVKILNVNKKPGVTKAAL